VDQSTEAQNANIHSFCKPAGLLHDAILTPPSKWSRVGFNDGPRPLGYQPPGTECVCISRSGSEVAGVSSGGEGSGN